MVSVGDSGSGGRGFNAREVVAAVDWRLNELEEAVVAVERVDDVRELQTRGCTI